MAAQGTGGSIITVVGGGFQAGSRDYSCHFKCDGLSLQTTATASSSTELSCAVPLWTQAVCTADVTAYRGLSLISGVETLTLEEGWLTFDQSVGPQGGGTLVSFSGEGFVASREYQCIWIGEDTDAEGSAPLVVINNTQVQCSSPVWPHPDTLTRVEIRRPLPGGGASVIVNPARA